MTCPKCQSSMSERQRAGVSFAQCDSCEGIFLDRADRGDLVELENDWHTSRGQHTQPLPRITPDMSAPPVTTPTRTSRSFLDALFG